MVQSDKCCRLTYYFELFRLSATGEKYGSKPRQDTSTALHDTHHFWQYWSCQCGKYLREITNTVLRIHNHRKWRNTKREWYERWSSHMCHKGDDRYGMETAFLSVYIHFSLSSLEVTLPQQTPGWRHLGGGAREGNIDRFFQRIDTPSYYSFLVIHGDSVIAVGKIL